MTLSIVDIGGRPALEAEYGTRIPVLVLPDGTRFAGRASAGDLDRAFRAAAGGAPRGWLARLRPWARGEHR
jgi:hypothetical protein